VDNPDAWRYSCGRCGHEWTIAKDDTDAMTRLPPLVIRRGSNIAS
jgi:hypothetical protein